MRSRRGVLDPSIYYPAYYSLPSALAQSSSPNDSFGRRLKLTVT